MASDPTGGPQVASSPFIARNGCEWTAERYNISGLARSDVRNFLIPRGNERDLTRLAEDRLLPESIKVVERLHHEGKLGGDDY